MAAYAALISLSEATELLLNKIILQKTTTDDDGVHHTSSSRNLLPQQLQNQIESLRESTNFLRSVLEKSPTHPFEAQMKDAAERAQVVIERFVLDQLRWRLTFDEATLKSLSDHLRRIHEDLISPMVDKIRNNIISESSVGILDSCPLRQLTYTSSLDPVLSQLRHIISFCWGALPSPKKEENSPLENLETLSAVMNLDCSEDLIEMIPNVKKLGIFYFGVERGTHSIENIERLSRLEKLKVWVMVPFSAPQNVNLGFPTTLRRLTLRGLRLSDRDLLVIGRLPNLQALKLRRVVFEGDEWRITTTHQGFEKLDFLLLDELGLRHWLCDRGNNFVFPMLTVLVIRACNKLNEIEEVVQDMPSVILIMVVGCTNKSLIESAKRIGQSNENLRVLFG